MTRRSMTASFAPGAYVFPGGGIDAAMPGLGGGMGGGGQIPPGMGGGMGAGGLPGLPGSGMGGGGMPANLGNLLKRK